MDFLKLISQDHDHDSNKLKMHDTQSNVLNNNLTYIISINVKEMTLLGIIACVGNFELL